MVRRLVLPMMKLQEQETVKKMTLLKELQKKNGVSALMVDLETVHSGMENFCKMQIPTQMETLLLAKSLMRTPVLHSQLTPVSMMMTLKTLTLMATQSQMDLLRKRV